MNDQDVVVLCCALGAFGSVHGGIMVLFPRLDPLRLALAMAMFSLASILGAVAVVTDLGLVGP